MVIETGLSDFHKMCITVMKMYYSKQKPTIIHYRKFRDFSNDSFIKDLQTLLTKQGSKEIMKRSRLRNNFLNTRSDLDRKAYDKLMQI